MNGGADSDQARLSQFQIEKLSNDEIIKKAKILLKHPNTTFEVHPLDNALIHLSAQYYASHGENVTDSHVLEEANKTVESVLGRYNNQDAFKEAWKNNGYMIQMGWKNTLIGLLRRRLLRRQNPTSGRKKRNKRKTKKRKNKKNRTRRHRRR